MKVAIVILAVVAVAAADMYAKPVYKSAEYKHADYSAPAHYKFDWAVNDDYTYVNMGQYEGRDGDHTKGNYWVVLPDGRKQNVNYHVDGYSGFVADVTYDGYAKVADYKPTYSAPAYKPAHY